ncbi:glutamate formimidoyltransferase [candidate division LCP-89 bacterium B3_LCP]|uniref:glutamate formimidoyltransferase n=1 Tax=candidate division LCP-89 bacterium B3_LCP TaxID=2012998 RepID=A0A532V3J5_UNCL8|nr:MAG: glutamate formimidoyltransferase [candidate division LCP-89 bacterium B3_LCP]
MDKIVECVPNFSEGRDKTVLEKIAQAVRDTDNAVLLDFDPNGDYHRTVFTFVGTPDGVLQAALNAYDVAADLIDMSTHKGEHPRMGAADVVPFIPVRGVNMEDCVAISEKFGEAIAKKHNLPVYLYEESARTPQRSNLAKVRKGEYEALEDKLKDPQWKPDFGEAVFNPKLGGTVTGARFFLIAYNANVKDPDSKKANKIALTLRESGYAKRDDKGEIIRDENGKAVKISGKLKSVKGLGVPLEEYQISQVSMNLVNYDVTPPHVAYEAVLEEAKILGATITGSEIVGLTPLEPLLQAGKFYRERLNQSTDVSDEELVQAAVEGMGLSDLYPFEAKKKVIEYLI